MVAISSVSARREVHRNPRRRREMPTGVGMSELSRGPTDVETVVVHRKSVPGSSSGQCCRIDFDHEPSNFQASP